MRTFYGIVIAALLFGQNASPIRIGPNGDKLTSDDIAQITALVSPSGCVPWLLFASDVGFASKLAVRTFCEARSTDSAVRRGVLQEVLADIQRGHEGLLDTPRTWTLTRSDDWAQVAVPKVRPDDVASAGDVSRPFRVDPKVSDDDVLAIVQLIRSSPDVPVEAGGNPPPAAKWRKVPGDWPIDWVRLVSPDLCDVTLPDVSSRERSLMRITVERRDHRWVVVRASLLVWD